MKRKTLTLTICFLALVSIVSIGFASWVISRPVVEQTETGSITAEAVETKGYDISLSWQNGNKIHFGESTTWDSTQNGWITTTGAAADSLVCTLIINVSNMEEFDGDELKLSFKGFIENVVDDEEDDVLFDLSTPKANGNAFQKALAATYIAAPTVSTKEYPEEGDPTTTTLESDVNGYYYLDKDNFEKNDSDSSGKCYVTFTFAWGTKFGSKNPMDHYNSKTYTAALGSEAETALNAIKAIETEKIAYKVFVDKAAQQNN